MGFAALPPMKKAALVVLIGGYLTWSPFWVWYQFHFHTRFVGPFYTFSLTFLPLVIGSGLSTLASAKPKNRPAMLALLALGILFTVGLVPLVRACGVHIPETR